MVVYLFIQLYSTSFYSLEGPEGVESWSLYLMLLQRPCII